MNLNNRLAAETLPSKKVYLFVGVFFKKKSELHTVLKFIKKKVGQHGYSSHNIAYRRFPLCDELFSVFYPGDTLISDQFYYNKLVSIASPVPIKKLPKYIQKIRRFQKRFWLRRYDQMPIHLGYLYDSKVISIYQKPGAISVPGGNGLHQQVELLPQGKSFSAHPHTLSLFKTKPYLTFFSDLKRLIGH